MARNAFTASVAGDQTGDQEYEQCVADEFDNRRRPGRSVYFRRGGCTHDAVVHTAHQERGDRCGHARQYVHAAQCLIRSVVGAGSDTTPIQNSSVVEVLIRPKAHACVGFSVGTDSGEERPDGDIGGAATRHHPAGDRDRTDKTE